jgi:predicted amidohydrolase
MLGQVAKQRSTYIVAGIYEREGHTVYNTAVLIDREGRIAGKYRKVYLPIEEIEGGLTAGGDFPVFRTDFGTIGLMICYDVFFPDPARALARQGAEVLLMPIWGGDEVLARARAIDNQVFLVASGYDHPTYIMNPEGTRITAAPERGRAALGAEAPANATAGVATVDLAHRWVYTQLGDMKARRMKEWRVDVKVP